VWSKGVVVEWMCGVVLGSGVEWSDFWRVIGLKKYWGCGMCSIGDDFNVWGGGVIGTDWGSVGG